MESILKKTSKNEYDLTVELGAEELTGYISRAEDYLGKGLEVDGFRKGKAPKEMIRKQLGSPVILEAAMDMAMKESLSRTLEEKKLDVISVSGLKILSNDAKKLSYRVLLTLFPAIKMPDLKSIKVKRRPANVGEEDLILALEDIRSSRATFSDKEGPALAGDRVEIDFEATLDGKPVDGASSKNHPLTIGKNVFVPGFEENLAGMNKEEEKRFALTFPNDYFRKELAAKKLDFKVKMVDIKKVELPPLDDNFAKSLGSFTDLKSLKHNIREGIAEEKKMKEKQRLVLEILEKIVEKSDIEVSDKMVEQKLEEMIMEFDKDLHQKGLELGPYLAHMKKTQDDLRKEWRKNADRQLKTGLIVQRIAKDQKFSAPEAEIEELVSQTVQALVSREGMEPNNLDLSKLREDAAARILNAKTMDYLEMSCSV